MHLYFSPLACSMASRIALYEAGAEVEYTNVDTRACCLPDGSDFRTINPMGMVPVLREGDWLLTENTAILTWIADRYPDAGLTPASAPERARLQQWLGFINSELHKALFVPILDRYAPETVKAYARDKASLRLGLLQEHLQSREFLLDRFTVADAYLFTVLNWAAHCSVDLSAWQAVAEYFGRLRRRPCVSRALEEETALYRAQQEARAASSAAAH